MNRLRCSYRAWPGETTCRGLYLAACMSHGNPGDLITSVVGDLSQHFLQAVRRIDLFPTKPVFKRRSILNGLQESLIPRDSGYAIAVRDDGLNHQQDR